MKNKCCGHALAVLSMMIDQGLIVALCFSPAPKMGSRLNMAAHGPRFQTVLFLMMGALSVYMPRLKPKMCLRIQSPISLFLCSGLANVVLQ